MLRRFHGWVRTVSGFGHVVTTKSGIRLNLPTLLNVVARVSTRREPEDDVKELSSKHSG